MFKKLFDKRDRALTSTGLCLLLLFLTVPIGTFWQCVTLPFIRDDWGLLASCQSHDFASLMRSYFDLRGKLLYRPVGLTYLTLMFKAFGEMAWPCHALALCIHVLNSIIVFRIMRRLTEDHIVAVMCSLIYASAVAVHLEPLCWAVGIYDLGGAFCFFASIALFLSGQTFLSVLSFFVGTLFKESALVLPAVLAAIQLTGLGNWSLNEIKSLGRRILPHFVVLILVLVVRMLTGTSPLALSAHHPYVVDPLGEWVIENAYSYGGWMLQAFLSFGSVESGFFRFILNGLIVLAVFVAILQRSKSTKLLAGLSLWILLSLLPVLFMPNHIYRYYATYALPAFICAVLLMVKDLLTLLGLRQYRNIVLACAGTLSIVVSVGQSNRIFAQGRNALTLMADGTNGPVTCANQVEIVRRQLLRQLPRPADDATILLGGVDLWSFNKDSGPQVWYKRATLRVYDLKDLRRDAGGVFIENPVWSQVEAYTGHSYERIALDAKTLHAFTLADHTLHPIGPEELVGIAERQSGATLPPNRTR